MGADERSDDTTKLEFTISNEETLDKQVVEIGKQLKYLPTPEVNAILDHLQVDSLSDICLVSSSLSPYQKFIQIAVLEDFLKDRDIEVVEKFQFYLSEGTPRGPFEYIDIEISPGKTIKAVGYGHLFAVDNKNNRRLVLHLEEFGYKKYKLRVYSTMENQEECLNFIKGLEAYAKKNNVLKGKKITPAFRHVISGDNYTWDSVILPDETKSELKKNISLLLDNIEIYKSNNLTFKRGLILKGPPGTGKTLIGKILCNEIDDTTFVWVTPGDLDGPRSIKMICELARELSPSILFLEDIDLYGSHRERENREILGELMNQLDGLIDNEFVIVIATTNRPKEIEDALRNRPGRFDRIIDVPPPDKECRRQMLEFYLKNLQVSTNNIKTLIEKLSEETDEYTGAHIKELINSAIISAIDEKSLDESNRVILKPRHFIDNVKIVKTKKITATGFSPPSADNALLDNIFEDDDE